MTRLALAVLLAAGVVGTVAGPSAAADGFAVSSDSTYTVDPAASVVHGVETVTVTHQTPDREVAGGVEYRYLDTLALPVAATATALQASADGVALAVTTQATSDPSTVEAVVTLPRRLRFGDTVTVTLTFDLVGAPPRAADRTRVGADFATFGVYALGDQGETTVQINVPDGWTNDATTDGFTESTVQGQRVLTMSANTDADGIFALVSLRNPKTPVTPLTVGKAAFEINPWPGDTQWSDFVTQQMTSGLPVLEAQTGLPWPVTGTTTIREDAAPGVRGFDGWYDAGAGQVALSEGLDPATLYHELAHAWASGDTYSARWLREGVAEYLSRQTTTQLGLSVDAPLVVPRDDANAVPLNGWEESALGRASITDTYAYPASRQVMEQLFTGLSAQQVTEVLRSASLGESAYDQPSAQTSLTGAVTDWQRFLDLVEVRGGQPNAADVFSQWVLTADQQPLLADRATARTQYAALDAADGTWLPPLAVRDPMTRWAFSDAQTAMTTLTPAAARAIQIQDAAAAAGMAVPAGVQAVYEGALTSTDVAKVVPELEQSAQAITDLGSAIHTAQSSNPAARIGTRVLFIRSGITAAATDLDQGNIERGQKEAANVASRARWAVPLGVAILLAVVLAIGAALMLALRTRRRSLHRVQEAAPVEGTSDGTAQAGSGWASAASPDVLAQAPAVLAADPAPQAVEVPTAPPQPTAPEATLVNVTHRTTAELEAFMPTILRSPRSVGTLDLIVRRPSVGQREVLAEGELDLAAGLVGDTWITRSSKRTRDGSPHPDMQLNVINARLIGFLAGDPERRALAGDQLYLDLDLSPDNLPPGSRLTFGDSSVDGIPAPVIEVTDQPHTGCRKFVERFGASAMQFVNGPTGRSLRLRGLNARVIVPGVIWQGQPVTVSRPHDPVG